MKRYLIPLFLAILLIAPSTWSADEDPLKVLIVSGSDEYKSQVSMPKFKEYLEKYYTVECEIIQAQGFEELPGTEKLEECDTALFFTRRRRIDGESLQNVIDYCRAGKPIVAVRTASHGFQNFLEFDKEILGGNYHGHYGNGPTQIADIIEKNKNHPVLDGITQIRSRYSLYKTAPLADDCTLLMESHIPGEDPEPAAWTRIVNGGRVFYTQLGGVEDFENDTFKRMIANALFWSAKRDAVKKNPEVPPMPDKAEGKLHLKLRTRVQPFKSKDQWEPVYLQREIPVANTAILICDMWDKHWCEGASERCEEIAKKMNPVVQKARDKGIRIIHCPSGTMAFYRDRPQRLRMQQAPKVEKPDPMTIPEHPMPIEVSNEGCDTDQEPWYRAWTRQTKLIDIEEYDGITDQGDEVFNFLKNEGIDTVFIMGVHTNMCILHRSFAIKPMTRLGMNYILVRDLTDAMYDPDDEPHVSHERGTELVIEHIEKYWCPTTTSENLIKALPK